MISKKRSKQRLRVLNSHPALDLRTAIQKRLSRRYSRRSVKPSQSWSKFVRRTRRGFGF